MSEFDFVKFVAERNKALAEMDMNYLRRMLPEASDDYVRLMAGHKARIECTDVPDALKNESRQWLRERGHKMLDGSQP